MTVARTLGAPLGSSTVRTIVFLASRTSRSTFRVSPAFSSTTFTWSSLWKGMSVIHALTLCLPAPRRIAHVPSAAAATSMPSEWDAPTREAKTVTGLGGTRPPVRRTVPWSRPSSESWSSTRAV